MQKKKWLNPVSKQQFKRRRAAGWTPYDAVHTPSIKSNGTKKQREKVRIKRTPIKDYVAPLPLTIKNVPVWYTEKDREKYVKELVERFDYAMWKMPFKKETLQENAEMLKSKVQEYRESEIEKYKLRIIELEYKIGFETYRRSKLINLSILVALLLAIFIVQSFIS